MRGLRPQGLLQVAMAIVGIVVSVQIGRGWLRQWSGLRPLLVLANSVAVVVGLVVWTAGVTSGEVSLDAAGAGPLPGIALDGAAVSNIYASDSAGTRITGVRLFDQDGRPLNGDQSSMDENGNPVAVNASGEPGPVVRDTSGTPLLNVYPRVLVGSDPWQVVDPANPGYPDQSAPAWSPPLSIVPLSPSSSATGQATPTSAQATPSARPAVPTASPTQTAKPSTTAQPAPTVKPAPPKASSRPPATVPSPSVTRSVG